MAINQFDNMLKDSESIIRHSGYGKNRKTGLLREYTFRGMKSGTFQFCRIRNASPDIPAFFKTVVFVFAAMISFSPGFSQITDPLPETDIRPVSFSGSLGVLSETYTARGIDPRRPPSMGQIMLNTNFSLFGLRSGFNMLYSTDDNPLRQSVNKFYYQGSWRWLTVSAGDVAPRFSKYSLGGVTVRGGMIELHTGLLQVSATAGRTKRRVEFSPEPGFRDPSFERWLYGVRLGLGRQQRTGFALSGVYVYDIASSIEHWDKIRPAENISVTPEFNLSLFSGALRLESNVTFSAFSMDVNSDKILLEEFPGSGLLTGIFEPRSSTRLDYAGEISANMNAGPFRASGGYERVQPGFMSLGLGQIRSDQELIRFRPQARLMKGRVNIGGNYSRGKNNLLETRLSTIHREQIGTNVNLRVSRSVNLSLSYMQMQNENKPTDMSIPAIAETHQKQVSRNFMLSPTMVFRSGTMAHSVSLNGSYQVLDDRSQAISDGTRTAAGFTNLSTGLSYGTSLPTGLSLNLGGNMLANEAGAVKSTGYSLNTSAGYAFFKRKLSTSLALGWSQNGIEYVQIVDRTDPLMNAQYIKRLTGQTRENGIIEGEYVVRQWSKQFMMNLSASYRLPNGNPLRLMVRGLLNMPPDKGVQAYNEMHATLRYDHRF